jgi:hypothetical protein
LVLLQFSSGAMLPEMFLLLTTSFKNIIMLKTAHFGLINMPARCTRSPFITTTFHLLSSEDVPQASPLSFNCAICESKK